MDRVKRQNHWLHKLTSVEPVALSLLKTMDLAAIEPEVLECRTGQLADVFDYWRVVLSSEPQQPSLAGAGRSSALVVRDKTSGGLLGLIALSDPPNTSKPMMRLFEWDKNDEMRLAHQHQVIMMRRCLPVYEFGGMVGGKLLALIATSQEVMRLYELRFSFQYVFFIIRTLHGKGSQYNRLHPRGIELIEVDDEGKGFYAMELRKKGLAHMRTGSPVGGTAMHKLGDQVAYWKDRWLKSRLESTGFSPTIAFDPERYRLSNMLAAKRMTNVNLTAPDNDDAD
jgi:hypothetical protein